MAFGNLARHMREMHTTKRFLCPLTPCHFKAKRMNMIRKHWQMKHRNLRFPELNQRKKFGYKTDTSSSIEKVVRF